MSFSNSLCRFAWSPIDNVFRAANVWVIKKSCVGHIDGVAICDMNISGCPDDGFLNLTREAMALIKSVDPRRHRRVCRRLNYIVNMILISGGDYDHKGRICNVDYAKHFTTAYPEWNVRRYACLLIHEATHGVISAKGILYDKERRQRIEKLCHHEEYRFALHLEPGWAEENTSLSMPSGGSCIGKDRCKKKWQSCGKGFGRV